jgi:glycosyltransferase involved in cell wall biosynthesis
LKLAFVVQRYGAGIAGGSESHCREYAERLADRHDVTLLTTCARDYVTWANSYPAGSTILNGVTVRRFPVARPRRLARFADLSDQVFGESSAPELEEDWFRENGPDSPALLDCLRHEGDAFHLVVFFTYRYALSYFGLPIVAERSVLVPTAEEDPAITLGVLRDYFRKPAGYLFNTPEERALIEERAGRPVALAAISGVGVEPARLRASRAPLDALGIPHDFVLCLGRVDHNKGADSLARVFIDHLERGGDATTLVFAGPATVPLPEHSRVRALGFVPNDVRDALIDHARALIIPSPYESLSIVLLEAWNRGLPALVNGACRVLKGQVRRANGGLYYRSPLEFSEALTCLLTRPETAAALGRQGQAYVDREYRWPIVMGRVEGLLTEVAARSGTLA